MGCICNSNESRQDHERPAQQQRREVAAQRPVAGNVLQDVNEQYQIYFDILSDQSSGKGLKKTFAYISHIDQSQIEKLRDTFWETRVEGKQEIWATLRSIISENEETAANLVEMAELKPIHNSLQHVYDKLGQKYDVPIFCINDPIEFAKEKTEDRGLVQRDSNEAVTLFIRSVAFNGKDLEVNSNLKQSVVELKEEINMQIQVKHQMQCSSIKLFSSGKELLDSNTVGRYNIMNKSIIIAHLKLSQDK